MERKLPKWLLYSALFVLYVLHNDLWLWNDTGLFLGLPVGLLYHVAFCIAASLLFILMVTRLWPARFEPEAEEEGRP